jgi:hypothetical protein
MAKTITLRNGKAGRLVKSGLQQHDRAMHGGKKAPKIVVKSGKRR